MKTFQEFVAEASNPLMRQVRRIVGPGKTTSERGNNWFHHTSDPEEVSKKLTAAGIKHHQIKHSDGTHSVSVSYMSTPDKK